MQKNFNVNLVRFKFCRGWGSNTISESPPHTCRSAHESVCINWFSSKKYRLIKGTNQAWLRSVYRMFKVQQRWLAKRSRSKLECGSMDGECDCIELNNLIVFLFWLHFCTFSQSDCAVTVYLTQLLDYKNCFWNYIFV